MASKVSDTWLWLGLGVTLYVGFECVLRTLDYLVETVEIDDHPNNDTFRGFATVDQTDRISPESLKVLATCQNINIRKAATRILLDRILSDTDAFTQIIHDVEDSSVSQEGRHRAKNALSLFYTDGYTVPRHIRAQLPQALRRVFPPRENVEISATARRTSGRLQAILNGISGDGVTEEDVENMFNFLQENMDRLDLSSEERSDFETFRNRRQGLLAQRSELLTRLSGVTGEETVPRPRRRTSDDSPREQERRRRRREAMVLNEGDHPLGQEDIFQRRRTEDLDASRATGVGADSGAE